MVAPSFAAAATFVVVVLVAASLMPVVCWWRVVAVSLCALAVDDPIVPDEVSDLTTAVAVRRHLEQVQVDKDTEGESTPPTRRSYAVMDANCIACDC
jgi:hypothetical protein